MGVLLKDLPAKIGISERMFYAYRSGGNPISDKAWRKLEQAEATAEEEGFILRSFRSANEAPAPSASSSAASAALRFASSSSAPDVAVVREDATPYRFMPMGAQCQGHDGPEERLGPVLERIAAALEEIARKLPERDDEI